MHTQAILIMESEASQPSASWSRLYQVADSYLELGYHLEGTQGFLLGQVLHPGEAPFPSAQVTLISPKGTPLQRIETPLHTRFRMAVGPLGKHHLELTLGPTTFHIPL
ncbi:hypothetical protein [Meiothermus rufus]|uniref:hypothetical protein n=1 Tax=Meiothermus rufus TaxID=604332 RepID=UPI0004153002|nr:hypothetical protein [Meiothermus rufus]